MQFKLQTSHQMGFLSLVLLCVVFQLLDWHSTWIYFGEKSESNIALIWLESKVGLLWALLIFKVLALMLVALYVRWRFSRAGSEDVWVFIVVNFFYSVIVTRNYIS